METYKPKTTEEIFQFFKEKHGQIPTEEELWGFRKAESEFLPLLQASESELEDEKKCVRGLRAELDTLKKLVSGENGETLLILNELIDTKLALEINVNEFNTLKTELQSRHEAMIAELKNRVGWDLNDGERYIIDKESLEQIITQYEKLKWLNHHLRNNLNQYFFCID